VNEAWRVLRDPIRRAEALFRLAGIPVGEMNEPTAPGGFLMYVLEHREALSEARAAKDIATVRKLAAGIKARKESAESKLTEGFANGAPPEAAVDKLLPLLGELRFYRRFLDEAEAIEEEAQEEALGPGASS
jgi:molecular chaperone HscB